MALLLGAASWLLFSPDDERVESQEAPADEDEPERAAAPAEVAPPPAPRPRPTASAPAPERDDGLNVVGPHPDDPHEPGMHPHPETPEHKRIYAENRLIQELNDLMSFRKVKEMREKLVEYQKLDPEDIDKSQMGYEVIADCIEFPGDASLAAARHFYDTQRHSTLRRYVRRICFENSN